MTLTKLVILFASISFLPITIYFMKTLLFKKLQDSKKKQLATQKDVDFQGYLKFKNQLKDIYENERKCYYEEARSLFNQQMKTGRLSKDHIKYLRKLLENSLGDTIHDFDNYTRTVKKGNKEIKKKGFENDAHRIYTYMKSYYIEPKEWQKIIEFLKGVA